jgi:hypothetical protein
VLREVPLADVSAKIRELLTQEKVNELMVSWLQSLRSESKVSVPGPAGSPGREYRRSDGARARSRQPPRRWWKYLLLVTRSWRGCRFGSVCITSPPIPFRTMSAGGWSPKIERVTGGRAEVGSFHIVPFHLQVEVRNITVHGKESPADVPLVHADSLLAQVKVISFLRTEFGFHSLTLEHPVIHIAVAPDGTTNVPAPRMLSPEVLERTPEHSALEKLFALSIDHLSVHNGELQWADRKIPLDLAAHDTNLQMDYSFLRGRYESHLSSR